MPARLETLALVGLGAQKVTVEVDLSPGLPSFTIVGLPDKAVDEARERVRSAIKNAGFQFPMHRITVNLAPADIPKVGPSFDLPISLGILMASGVIAEEHVANTIALGELSLGAEIQPVDGILPMMLTLHGQNKRVILPAANTAEAQLVDGIRVAPATHLRSLVEALQAKELPEASYEEYQSSEIQEDLPDIGAIAGLEQVKRVLEIAAAGNHNIFMIGPPGTGKTLLARAFASIMPELDDAERLEVLSIRSAAGLLRAEEVRQRQRPVRSPHHTASPVAIVGGGSKLRPGEASLAHRGVLFLDEFPEFPRMVIEALREPLEEGHITIARALGAVTFPARFTLIAAANPCPCGYYNDPDKQCRCSAADLVRYQRKLSGPLMDRMDLLVTVPRQATDILLDQPQGTTSAEIRERVGTARKRQYERHQTFGRKANGELSAKEVKEAIRLTDTARALILEAGQKLHLSGRGLHRLLKVARTIADLRGEDTIDTPDIAEALQYRQTDMIIG